MKRRHLFTLSAMAVALGSGSALAERLGGSYRGPEEAQVTKDTSQSGDSSSGKGDEGGREGGGGGDDGGGGVGDSGGSDGGGSGGGEGGGSGGGEGGGSGGGESGGGGGDDMGGGGGASGGGDRGTSDSGGGPKASGGGAGMGKGKAAAAQDAFIVVSWYFEHNREQFINRVVEAANRRIRPGKGSAPAVMSVMPRDTRVRSSVTVEDREKIFDVLKKNTLATEDVVRDAAVIALGKIGTPDAVQILRTRLEEEAKWDIKEDVLLALGIARTKEAVDALEATLKGNKTRLHVYALMALGLTQDAERSGALALDYFNQNLKRKNGEEAVSAAAMALGSLRYEKAIDPLLAAGKAKSTPDMIKVFAAQALGRMGTEEAMKGLESILEGSDSDDVRRAAILGLGNYHEPAVARLLAGKKGIESSDTLAAGFAAVSLAKVLSGLPETEWKKAPDVLRDVALDHKKNAIKSQYANLALSMFDGGIDADVRKQYAEEIKASSASAEVLSSIAMACGTATVAGMDSSLSGIAEAASADSKLRGYAAFALGMTSQTPATVKTLRAVYDGSDKVDVQRGAVLGLGLAGDRSDVPFLLKVIEKTDKAKAFAAYTRGAAVVSLGLIHDGDSVGRIQDLLRSPDPLVRAYAIAALGYMADKDPAPVLPTLFEHGNFRREFNALKIAMRTL